MSRPYNRLRRKMLLCVHRCVPGISSLLPCNSHGVDWHSEPIAIRPIRVLFAQLADSSHNPRCVICALCTPRRRSPHSTRTHCLSTGSRTRLQNQFRRVPKRMKLHCSSARLWRTLSNVSNHDRTRKHFSLITWQNCSAVVNLRLRARLACNVINNRSWRNRRE